MHIHMAMVMTHGVQFEFWELKLMMFEITAKSLLVSTTFQLNRSKSGSERRYSTPKSSGSSSRIFGVARLCCFS
jgi:hypothetical protein